MLRHAALAVALLCACNPTSDIEEPVDTGEDMAPFWADSVDAHWGEAPDEDTRLRVFDEVWDTLDQDYAGFVTSDVDWPALREELRPQVAEARSYGHFYQLHSEVFERLQDGHTRILSYEVCGTAQSERPPVFHLEGRDSRLGACLTPLDDDSLLVYRVDPDNPAGLEPGDRVLGYDGQPWRTLLARIDRWKLPTCAVYEATDAAHELASMASAGSNAHLFDQLDVVRFGQTEVEHIDTDGLLEHETELICGGQVGAPGVGLPWPQGWSEYDGTGAGAVTWGRLEGTDKDIGYIAVSCWLGEVQADFAQAVTELMDTEGLIVDYRFNLGGSTSTSFDGLALLFGEDQEDVYSMWGRDPDGGYEDMVAWYPGAYDLSADPQTEYTAPIALLTGPGAISAGDGGIWYLSLHPQARRFGRTSSGSFGTITQLWRLDPFVGDLYATYTPGIMQGLGGTWLHAAELPIDEPVWLEPQDVVEGRDTVVEAAIDWIESE